MAPITPELTAALSLTGGLAIAMIVLGRSYSMLERPIQRHCVSCGKLVRRRQICRCSR